MRWLKIARAEFVRDATTALRYPIEVATGVVIMYVLFMALYTGARSFAGGAVQPGESGDAMVIRFSMWFFALLAINSMSVDIESEARQGTLEQVYLNAPSFLGLVWVRGVVHVALGAVGAIALSVLIQATTGNWLDFSVGTIGLAVAAIMLTVLGLLGFGLILGGLTLVFKRIGQLSALLQFGLFFIAAADHATLRAPWDAIMFHLPLGGGVRVLNLLLAQHDVAAATAALPALLLDSIVYAAIGSVVFYALERVARRSGTLSHY